MKLCVVQHILFFYNQNNKPRLQLNGVISRNEVQTKKKKNKCERRIFLFSTSFLTIIYCEFIIKAKDLILEIIIVITKLLKIW